MLRRTNLKKVMFSIGGMRQTAMVEKLTPGYEHVAAMIYFGYHMSCANMCKKLMMLA